MDQRPHPPACREELPGRVAGIDYGTVRIGVALSDRRRSFASPLETYRRGSPAADAEHFRRLAAEHDIRLFVVGLPVHLDGRESQKAAEARRFAQWLAQATGVEVQLFDERFTTVHAEHLLREARLSRAQRKRRLDMLAAQGLLEAWLESSARGEPPRGLDEPPLGEQEAPRGSLETGP